MINGVVLGKLRKLDVVLDELKSLGSLTEERLGAEWILRRAVERDLQLGVEILLDVCHRLLALLGQSPAATSREALEACVRLGILEELEPYGRMVGFRNMIVHRYDHIESSILVDVVNNHLQDFERFRDEVMSYVSQSS